MTQTQFENARLVLPTGVVDSTLLIEDGAIKAVGSDTPPGVQSVDCQGDYVIPGLIDIHTDNLEKHYMPRPGAMWDPAGSAMAHDGQMATAGVTTVFDSLSLSGNKNGLDRGEALKGMTAGLDAAEAAGGLRIDHLLHLRCELSNPNITDLVEPQLEYSRLKLLSVMDHTPGGNRQSGGMEKWRNKQLAQGKTEAEIEAHYEAMMSWRDLEGVDARRRWVVEQGNAHSIPVASHDDRTEEQIELAHKLGCKISEFPISDEAAKAAKKRDMITVMGGPNFVRGKSHGDNASAREVAEAGHLDALCSDYVPLSMLRAAFMLSEAPFNWSIEKAIGTVTEQPAKMTGLDDRGTLETGKRADIVRVRHSNTAWPIIQEVWSEGRRVV